MNATDTQTKWTEYGVSESERAAIEYAVSLVGRTFLDSYGAAFTVASVADCRPHCRGGAIVTGSRRYIDGRGYAGAFSDCSSWVGDLGDEVQP
jgi:hypothetical protein